LGRYREYNPNQVFFHPIDGAEIRGHNPLLRKVDEYVEKYVDIGPFDTKLGNDALGAPAIHPRILLKVLFYAFATGIRGSRKIEDHLRWDPNFLILSSQETIDHSTICGFLNNYREEILDCFSKMDYVLAQMGYLDNDFIAIDGTKIKASAGKNFTGTAKDFRKKLVAIKEKVSEMLDNFGKDEDGDSSYRTRKERKLEALEREQEKIEEFLKEVKNGVTDDQTRVNLNDRDACVVKDQGSFYSGYNCQLAVEGKHHFIVAQQVFNEAPDQVHLVPMVRTLKLQTASNLHSLEIAFDAGYFTAENLKYCLEEELNVYLPEGKGPNGSKQHHFKTLSSQDCQPSWENNAAYLLCPGNQRMKGKLRFRKDKAMFLYIFRPDRNQCLSCPLSKRCYGNAKYKSFEVAKNYLETTELRLQMREKVASKQGKRRYADRACVIEHVFGEIKEILNLRRFYHRGLEMVQTIWAVTAMAYNLRKLAAVTT